MMKMTRSNRYPYTRSQWIRTTVNYYTYDSIVYFSQHVLENRLTGEIKIEEVKD